MMKEVIDQARSHTERRGSTSSAGSSGPISRDSLASTGIVWECCDSIMALQRIGLHGLLVEKAREYREQLEDAIEELKDFRDGAEIHNQDEEDNDLHTVVVDCITTLYQSHPTPTRGTLHIVLWSSSSCSSWSLATLRRSSRPSCELPGPGDGRSRRRPCACGRSGLQCTWRSPIR